MDERTFHGFEPLTPSEFAQYLWSIAIRSERARRIFRSLVSMASVCRDAMARPVLRLAMKWIDRSARERDTAADTAMPPDGIGEECVRTAASDPVISYTRSGSPVIDKRRRVRLEPDEASTEDNPIQQASKGGSWNTRIHAVFAAFVGAAIRWATASPVPKISNSELVEQLLQSRAHRAIVGRRTDDDMDLRLVLGIASGDFAGDWRVAAYQWMKRYANRLRLEELVSKELPGASATARRCAVLRLIPLVASSLSDDHARNILAFLFGVVGRAIDPYNNSGEVVLARSAVVALLRQRPELDEVVIAALSAREANSEVSAISQLAAVALRSRGLAASLVVADVAARGRLSAEELESVARLADAPLRPLTDPAIPSGRGSFIPVGPLARRLACWLTVGIACTVAALVLRLLFPTVSPLEVPIAPAIATLALLATVQVFAANLSGARLPGVIARHTSQSWQLDLAYGSSLAMVGLAIWQPSQPGYGVWTLLRNWMSSVALVLWVCSLIIALLAVFRRVDFARAAAGFVSIRKNRARLVGSTLGRYQALTIELRSVIESSNAIDIRTDAVPGVWDRPINSFGRGIFLPSRSDMRRLIASKPVRDGLRLRITSVLGVTVNRYDVLAHALPLVEQSVDERWLSAASRRLKVRSNGRVDDINSAALALLKLAADLASTGDTGTAQQVAQSLTEFVNFHMAHTRRAREAAIERWRVRESLRSAREDGLELGAQAGTNPGRRSRDEADSVPVNPMFLAILQAAGRSGVAASGPYLTILEYVVRSLLRPSSSVDLGVTIVASAIADEDIDSATKSVAAHRLLRICALHTLERQHLSNFKFVLDVVVRLSSGKATVDRSRRLVSELTAFACRYDPALALAGVGMLEKLYDVHLDSATENNSGAGHFWSVGAASIAVGAQSVAVHVARVMHRRNLTSQVIAGYGDRDVLDAYAIRSEMFGGFLGDRPRDALATYGEFLQTYESWLAVGA